VPSIDETVGGCQQGDWEERSSTYVELDGGAEGRSWIEPVLREDSLAWVHPSCPSRRGLLRCYSAFHPVGKMPSVST
jgi:hypothetical protein